MRRHKNSETAVDYRSGVGRVRNAKTWLEVTLIGVPGRPIILVGKRVATEDVKLIRRDQEVGRIRIVRGGVCGARCCLNGTRRAQIKTTLDAVETLRQSSLQFVAKSQVQRQLSRNAPVVMKEKTMIDALD